MGRLKNDVCATGTGSEGTDGGCDSHPSGMRLSAWSYPDVCTSRVPAQFAGVPEPFQVAGRRAWVLRTAQCVHRCSQRHVTIFSLDRVALSGKRIPRESPLSRVHAAHCSWGRVVPPQYALPIRSAVLGPGSLRGGGSVRGEYRGEIACWALHPSYTRVVLAVDAPDAGWQLCCRCGTCVIVES